MINNVTLVGRLTKDPDLRYTSSGKGVAGFTLAVNRRFTNQAGQREADYIQCVIWGKSAETLANYAKKGSLIGIVGRLQSRSYENNEKQRVYVTEVVVETFQFLEAKTANEQRQNSQNNQQNDNSDPNFEGSTIDISDDDLPF